MRKFGLPHQPRRPWLALALLGRGNYPSFEFLDATRSGTSIEGRSRHSRPPTQHSRPSSAARGLGRPWSSFETTGRRRAIVQSRHSPHFLPVPGLARNSSLWESRCRQWTSSCFHYHPPGPHHRETRSTPGQLTRRRGGQTAFRPPDPSSDYPRKRLRNRRARRAR